MMINSNDLMELELKNRENLDPNRVCTYGIKCLDDCLDVIRPNELVVIGADSGVGKSETALMIAKHNAKNGKNVYLFFLEGGEEEAMRRMKWTEILNIYYDNPKNIHNRLEYSKWMTNRLNDSEVKHIEHHILPKMHRAMYGDRLHIFQQHNKFNIEDVYLSLTDFLKEGEENKKNMFGVDLIVIDHLHYFNLEDDPKTNESIKITKIIKRCQEISSLHYIPIVLISHLRKKTRDRGIPDQEDFHGSSNIPKIASTAIVISPAKTDSTNFLKYPTYFRIVKGRNEIKSNFAMGVLFDIKKREYEQEYKIYMLDDKGHTAAKHLEKHEQPYWARKDEWTNKV